LNLPAMSEAWSEFEEKAKYLYEKAPLSTRSSVKYSHKKQLLHVRLVNLEEKRPLLLKYQSQVQGDVKRMNALRGLYMDRVFGQATESTHRGKGIK
jgi:stalled ribosome alternative rescue factor ArfA